MKTEIVYKNIPASITECKDERLKTAGIAAFNRGSLCEKNEALLKCMEYNKNHHHNQAKQDRINNAKRYYEYFMQQPFD